MPEKYLTVSHLTRTDFARIFSKISINHNKLYNGTPCWEWTAYLDKDGYGQVGIGRKVYRTHRLLYAVFVEPLPIYKRGTRTGDSLLIDHLCRNRGCVSPIHLELVPHAVNLQRGEGGLRRQQICAALLTCKYGHPYDEQNTKLKQKHPNGKLYRACRRCNANWMREKRRQRKAQEEAAQCE